MRTAMVTVPGLNTYNMSISTRYFILSTFITCIACAGSLDIPITEKSPDQMMLRLISVRSELPALTAVDLDVATRAIERQCEDLSMNLSKEERDRLFFALINGRTPRQIILMGAGLLLAESAELAAPGAPVDGSGLTGDDFARWRHQTLSRTYGLAFVETYATSKVDDTRNLR